MAPRRAHRAAWGSRRAPVTRGAGHSLEQLPGRHGLVQELVDLRPHARAQLVVDAVGGNQHHGRGLLEGIEHGDPVTSGHADVEDHDGDPVVVEDAQCGVAVGGFAHLVAGGLEQARHRRAQVVLVLDHQHPDAHRAPTATRAGRTTCALVPAPGVLSTRTSPPWASTIRRTTASPAMPGPVSCTVMYTSSASMHADTRRIPPAAMASEAFETRLVSTSA